MIDYEAQGYKFYGGHTYKLFKPFFTWTEAKTLCEAIGGHLATSTSANKNAFLRGLASGVLWLGGTDAETEGVWKWVNGETWSYANWGAGEPNNSGNEPYLELLTTGLWNDITTSTTHSYICEWDSDLLSRMIRNHEGDNNLLGGDTTGHYHLTQAEYEALAVFLEERANGKYDNTISEDDYEKLTQILEAYNTNTENSGAVILTQAEYTKLTRLLNEMYPDNNTVEPTFFSEDEYNKITAILDAAYPNEDSTEPIFVNAATLNSLIDARIAEYMATH